MSPMSPMSLPPMRMAGGLRSMPVQVELTIRSEYRGGDVRVNWIHGGYVKEMLTLAPSQSVTRMVFLGQTLQAERADRAGASISEMSSLLLFGVRNASEIVIPHVGCLDASSDCEDWKRKGECARNAAFMTASCPRSCAMCPAAKPTDRRTPAVAGGQKCADDNESCVGWAQRGSCQTNQAYMHAHCRLSCGVCTPECADRAKTCAQWAKAGECESNAAYMRESCPRSCDFCGGGASQERCADELRDCALWASTGDCASNAKYMHDNCRRSCGLCKGPPVQSSAPPSAAAVSERCADQHSDAAECGRWAAAGQCETNSAWMRDQCRASCKLCDPCQDQSRDCAQWHQGEHCVRNRRFMAKLCQRTCGWCGKDVQRPDPALCADEDIKCEEWAKRDECSTNRAFMSTECRRSCKLCRSAPTPPAGGSSGGRATNSPPLTAPPRASPSLATPPVRSPQPDAPAADDCSDHDARCSSWAASGLCTAGANAAIMAKTCCASCRIGGSADGAQPTGRGTPNRATPEADARRGERGQRLEPSRQTVGGASSARPGVAMGAARRKDEL